jgi:hypothetical protein
MFSALSSFLPPALQLGGTQDKSLRPVVEPDTPQLRPQPTQPTNLTHDGQQTTDPEPSPAVDERGVRKKKERTHEVCMLHTLNSVTFQLISTLFFFLLFLPKICHRFPAI